VARDDLRPAAFNPDRLSVLIVYPQPKVLSEGRRMDFTALRYFSETANSRSIRAASERLHVSPSAISRQIAKLEHELRAPIFDRDAQGMRLTAAGELLQSRVEGMMREFARTKSHIAALQNLQAGTVDVYTFQAAIEGFITPVLCDYHKQFPNVLFNIIASSTDETIKALANGVAEIGLVLNPPVRETILSTEIFRDTIVAAVAPSHPLAGRKDVSLKEIAPFPLILAVPAFGLRQQVDKAFDRHGIIPKVFCVTNSMSLLKGIAGLDHQCTLLPRSAVAKEVAEGILSTIAVAEFAGDPMLCCACIRKTGSLSPAAKVFLDAIIDYCRRYR
jgi:DNA-binding transcriptional LysR family regulator